MSDEDEWDGEGAAGAALPVSIAAMRAWLRMDGSDEEDPLIADLIGAATGLCEAFTGQWVMTRAGVWRGQVFAGGRAVRLPVRPVVAVDEAALMVGGAEHVLDAAAYDVLIDRDGGARLRLLQGFGLKPIIVRYRGGMAETEAAVPDALRHGIIRMVQHYYETRDAPVAAGMPPAAVAALWQPWRIVSLGGLR